MSTPSRIALVAIALGLLTLHVGPRGTASASSPDLHADLDAVLEAHVRAGQVDYPAIASDARFTAYLGRIAAVDPASLPSSSVDMVPVLAEPSVPG